MKLAQNITDVISRFTGKDKEPSGEIEAYILKSMWVMMLSEFEGSIKDLVESHIDNVKKLDVNDIHICLLLQHFYSKSEDNITIGNIISVYKKNPKDITYNNFTRDYKPKYKASSVEKLFNTLGVFFSEEEISSLKMLDGMASTRDSIAHGDTSVAITKKELEGRIKELQFIFSLLKDKLSN